MLLSLWFLIWMSIGLGGRGGPTATAQQFYDSTSCNTNVDVPGTRYTCDSSGSKHCQTFLVYRAHDNYRTISNVSMLFNMSPEDLLHPTNNVSSPFQVLEPGREVLVPVNCSCSHGFYRSDFSYIYPGSINLLDIACGVYDGLIKSITLIQGSPSGNLSLQVGSRIPLHLKCACPDKESAILGFKYLVTYPLIEKDDTNEVGIKFNVSSDDIRAANHLDPNPTIYPSTTILLPLKEEPSINFNVPVASPSSPGFIPTVPFEEASRKHTELRKVYISVSVIGSTLVLVSLVMCGLYLKAFLSKKEALNMNSFARRSPLTSFSTPRSSQVSGPTPKSSTTSCLSPDLLESIKYSLCNYSTDELKKATNDFSEESKVTDDFYKGFIDNADLLIKQTRFEDTRQVIDVHSKVNHVNILKLKGVCYGEDDFSWCCLVFEFPPNGCLRDCLSSSAPSLRWNKRTQIAFDIATGLHYLHYCVVPPYTHLSVNSKTIFLTRSWRAKIAVFENSPSVGTSKEHESPSSTVAWTVGEHFAHSLVLEKEDIFAFGVVLLELLSAKEDQDWRILRESITFLGGGGSERGCFDQLRNFMDPNLKEDYPLAEALCLAVLAKACVEDDPLKRPSMDDILKVVARMGFTSEEEPFQKFSTAQRTRPKRGFGNSFQPAIDAPRLEPHKLRHCPKRKDI